MNRITKVELLENLQSIAFVNKEQVDVIINRILSLSSKQADSMPGVFGQELRTAFLIEKSILARSTTQSAIIGPSPRRFFLRPAIEPVVYSYKTRFWIDELTLDQVAPATSAMLGMAVGPRKKEQFSKPRSNMVTEFVSASQLETAWKIRQQRPRDFGPVIWAIQRFLDFNQIHPFADGNGRTARALLCADLSRAVNCDLIFLPLGPVIYSRVADLMRSYNYIARKADPTAFFTLLIEVLETSLEFAELDVGV